MFCAMLIGVFLERLRYGSLQPMGVGAGYQIGWPVVGSTCVGS